MSRINPVEIRRRLAAIFPGTFLLPRRDCRCVLHVAGAENDPNAEVGVKVCRPCRKYERYLRYCRPETGVRPTAAVC
ncbi:hypothetical protein [Nitrospira calida]|jgi:hypothetical protein